MSRFDFIMCHLMALIIFNLDYRPNLVKARKMVGVYNRNIDEQVVWK